MPATSQRGKPTASYEIRIRGRVGAELTAAFEGLQADVKPVETVLHGEIVDQAALHGVLDRVQALGLELIEVRRLPDADSEPLELPSRRASRARRCGRSRRSIASTTGLLSLSTWKRRDEGRRDRPGDEGEEREPEHHQDAGHETTERLLQEPAFLREVADGRDRGGRPPQRRPERRERLRSRRFA